MQSMKTPIAILLLAFAPTIASAEVPRELTLSFLKNQPHFDCTLVQPPASNEHEISLPEKSLLVGVAEAAREQGFTGGRVLIQLKFDENGFVQDIGIAKSSRNISVDIATANWARCARVAPGEFKVTLLPVVF